MFGISMKLKTFGYVDWVKRYPIRHTAKSLAGHFFHLPIVTSACVYDTDGKSHLYLKKTPNGVVKEEAE